MYEKHSSAMSALQQGDTPNALSRWLQAERAKNQRRPVPESEEIDDFVKKFMWADKSRIGSDVKFDKADKRRIGSKNKIVYPEI